MQKNLKAIYVIEHLEPELWEWCVIEYSNISKIVGKENLWITNVSQKEKAKLEKLEIGKIFSESFSKMGFDNKQTCILDPEAPVMLKPGEDFNFYLFGGILGDYPPRKRTEQELTCYFKNSSIRNIGKEQMSTDNAVFTVHKIAEGTKFDDLKFQDKLEIPINEFESIDLPYRYNVVNGKPFISDKIIEYLKKKKGF